MNIAVFIKRTTHHKGFGGLETQNKALCEGLSAMGHKVTVFSPKHELNASDISEGNLRYVFVSGSYRSLAGFGFLDTNNWVNRSYEEFLSCHLKERFDVVLSQSSAGLGIIRRKSKIGIPVISICHGSTLGELKTTIQSLTSMKDLVTLIPKLSYYALNFFGRQREFVLHSDLVVAVSENVKKALIAETFISEEKVKVVYNGVPIRPHPTFPKDKLIVFYVGLIHWSKGLKDLLVAVDKIKSKNFSLVIAGDGPHLEELRELVKSMALEEYVSVLGRIPNDQTIEYLLKSSIFVLPTRRVEGFPVSIIEAMSCSLPVVAADIGGVSEGVKNNVTGLLYEVGNTTALKDSLERLLSDAKLREEMGKNAVNMANSMFTVDVMLNKYEKIILEVLK